MLARSPTRADGHHCRHRRTVVWVDVQLAFRRILHVQHRLRILRGGQPSPGKTPRSTTSPDLPVGFMTRRPVQSTLPMTSQQQQETAATGGTRISLPRFLTRPNPEPIPSQAIMAICPELAGVPETFVRKHLSSMAPNMLEGVRTTRIVRGGSSEPLSSHLPVVFNNSGATPTVAPTHILALSAGDKDRYTLFLIHQLPFAAHCSAFPPLPPSSTANYVRSSTADLPVVCASIPSVEAFTLFQLYLYVKDTKALRAAFLPLGWADSIESIMHRAVLVKGFWSNASALRTIDDNMYDVIEECWAEILRNLERVHIV